MLAGIAGVLLASFLGISTTNAGQLTASAFSIVVLGGLGSVSGSLIAAYVVGYLETMTAYLIAPTLRPIPSLHPSGAGRLCAAAGPAGPAVGGRMTFLRSRLLWIAAAVVSDRGAAAVLAVRLSARRSDRCLLFRRLRHGLGSAVRLCRRGQFRPDIPDRPRRLYGRHPQQHVRPADPGLRHRGARWPPSSAGSCWRCRRCGCAGPISAWSRWSRCCCCRTSSSFSPASPAAKSA